MSILHHSRVFEHLNERILCRVPTEEKRLALTFDDGPHPNNTPRLLDMLARKGVRATFFVVGKQVKRFPEILQRAAAERHEIGNHSYHHWTLPLLPSFVVRRELGVTDRLIVEAIGARPRFMRPPRGLFSDRVLKISRAMGHRPVIGSVHPQDSRRPGENTIVNRVRKRIEPGAIIILHDGGWRQAADRSQTIAAADRLTDELLENGYQLQTMSELAGIPSLEEAS